jgi:hypothetical protein
VAGRFPLRYESYKMARRRRPLTKGIIVNGGSGLNFERVHIAGFDVGIDLKDVQDVRASDTTIVSAEEIRAAFDRVDAELKKVAEEHDDFDSAEIRSVMIDAAKDPTMPGLRRRFGDLIRNVALYVGLAAELTELGTALHILH